MKSEYCTRRQINIMLLATLDDLRCARKQDAIRYIASHRYFDIREEDLAPYPKSLTTEPRWHTLIAWGRKSCLVEGFIMGSERDSWEITREGVEEIASVRAKYFSGQLQARNCYMWTTLFKKVMQPGYSLSATDAKRPLDVYRDVQDSTISRLIAEYAF